MAEAGNKHLKAVINEMVWNIVTYSRITHGVGYEGVLQTTGPIMYSKALMPRLHRKGIQRIDYQELGLYPSIYERLDQGLTSKHTQMYRKHYSAVNNPVIVSSLGKRIHAYTRFKG
jgi:hypothetical protein